ncbi:Mth938-like domain-containing protein [Tropicimonas sp. IMCC34011]|uniref:Mth938-like domain-containing protein n=1 Tax=Tropicimonas sp. IMCC34011 TaxID=2248759 RepID=UPI000E27C1C0|nr:Mth938-like domain-containing protein [Tropicimonas sp. IMCC34011]
MQMTDMQFGAARPVDGYGPGFFRVAGEVHHGPMIAAPDGVHPWRGMEAPEEIAALAGQVDVVLLGTGADPAHLPAEFRAALEEAGIGVDAMSSPSACRTYNVCLAEGRRVALAALPV